MEMTIVEQSQRSRSLHRLQTGTPLDIERTIRGARQRLFDLQEPDGHWCAELEGDTILESEYVLLLFYLGGRDEKIRKAAGYIRQKQLPEGGWAIYPKGPADVSSSVKAYFVLKLVGDDPDAAHMAMAQQTIRQLGGIDACNSFTKLYLSIFGLYEWDRSPGVPPELMLFPKWSPFNIYEMSSWSRAIVVPLSIIWANKPSCPAPEHASLEELRLVDSKVAGPRFSRGSLTHHGWSVFFQVLDRVHKLFERAGMMPLRRRAVARAEQWTLQRLEKSDGLGAIFPPIVNTIIALHSQGYEEDHPVIQSQLAELEKLEIEEDGILRVQPCKSPSWDTALSINALAERFESNVEERLESAIEWLLDHEVKEPGDWLEKNPGGTIGGWYFEYKNEFYPDVDDTAQILTAVSKLEISNEELARRWSHAAQRAISWMLSMQNKDGGWASFDKGCDREFLTYIPFADHNAMIDPSTTDITARVLESLARFGYDRSSSAIRGGVEFLRREQEDDGTWYGRWGCNYLYGTFLALGALEAVGEDSSQESIQKAARWIRSVQNADGGWGESPESYAKPDLKGVGPSTASQTAWALLGMMSSGDHESDSLQRGVDYLLSTQLANGEWQDDGWTGTGFPEVFYLRYHLYATYFPLYALELWRQRQQPSADPATTEGPRPVES
jgi:squalene-hopene/tetraprenyl-beta-curcumene cyclase